MKKFSTYYWKFIMGMIVLTSVLTVYAMNQGSSLLAKDGEVILFVFLMALLIMIAEQRNVKMCKNSPLMVLGEMMFAIMLTPIFFMSYRYMAEVLSLGWILHLSIPMISVIRLLGMMQYVLVLVSPIMAILKAIQFVKTPYEKKVS
ncbi:hypothetical protein [Granulicatella elegans]|uniref:hypothetical protein n=1 Tax=Granulicatella elegans TaxID=137732 RepID=UPI001D158279|nr:hypothetical protein [Granulicatella elegans]UEA31850.1 hypothetical protein LK443_02535 [Granulicatella elegans]